MKLIGKDLLSDTISFEKEYFVKSYERSAFSAENGILSGTDSVAGSNTITNKMVLKAVYKIFKSHNERKQMRTCDIINYLCSASDALKKYNRGKQIADRQLASLLKPFGVSSCSLYYKTGNAKGYKYGLIRKAYKKYVRGVSSESKKISSV